MIAADQGEGGGIAGAVPCAQTDPARPASLRVGAEARPGVRPDFGRGLRRSIGGQVCRLGPGRGVAKTARESWFAGGSVDGTAQGRALKGKFAVRKVVADGHEMTI